MMQRRCMEQKKREEMQAKDGPHGANACLTVVPPHLLQVSEMAPANAGVKRYEMDELLRALKQKREPRA